MGPGPSSFRASDADRERAVRQLGVRQVPGGTPVVVAVPGPERAPIRIPGDGVPCSEQVRERFRLSNELLVRFDAQQHVGRGGAVGAADRRLDHPGGQLIVLATPAYADRWATFWTAHLVGPRGNENVESYRCDQL